MAEGLRDDEQFHALDIVGATALGPIWGERLKRGEYLRIEVVLNNGQKVIVRGRQ